MLLFISIIMTCLAQPRHGNDLLLNELRHLTNILVYSGFHITSTSLSLFKPSTLCEIDCRRTVIAMC